MLVVAAHDEADRIAATLAALASAFPGAPIWVADDGSSDRTPEIARLAGALAQMKGDWDVLKGRLGFNNPDGYGTTVSLRSENYRILSGTNGDSAWQSVLQQGRVADLLADADVERNCLQIDDGSGTPVPGDGNGSTAVSSTVAECIEHTFVYQSGTIPKRNARWWTPWGWWTCRSG